MISLIPQLDASRAYLQPAASSTSGEGFAEVLKTAATSESAPQSATTPTYQVQRGDNLSEIARKLGYSDPMELARANGIRNPNIIQPGQVLQLPAAGGGNQGGAPQTALAKAAKGKADPAVYAEKVGASSPLAASRSKGSLVTTSWYGSNHQGRTMANGQKFNMYADTAAHKTLPMGTQLRLTNPANGNSVEVQVTDRGPFVAGRTLDVSYNAARKLGIVDRGVAKIRMEKL